MEAKLAAVRKAAQETRSSLTSAEEECKRLQQLQAQSAQVPAAPPREHDELDGHMHDGPITVIVKEAEEVLGVLNGMLGKMPPQFHDAFVLAINGAYALPPGAEPPDSTAGEDGAAAAAGAAGAADTAASLQQRKAAEAANSRASGRFTPA